MYCTSKNMSIYISDTTYHHVRNRTFVGMPRVVVSPVYPPSVHLDCSFIL